jgi:hypothetical protein
VCPHPPFFRLPAVAAPAFAFTHTLSLFPSPPFRAGSRGAAPRLVLHAHSTPHTLARAHAEPTPFSPLRLQLSLWESGPASDDQPPNSHQRGLSVFATMAKALKRVVKVMSSRDTVRGWMSESTEVMTVMDLRAGDRTRGARGATKQRRGRAGQAGIRRAHEEFRETDNIVRLCKGRSYGPRVQ